MTKPHHLPTGQTPVSAPIGLRLIACLPVSIVLLALLLCQGPLSATAESISRTESWCDGSSGWSHRDAGNMAVSWKDNIAEGGFFAGTFASLAPTQFMPEIDSFALLPSPGTTRLLGNYWTNGLLPSHWSFDILAVDSLPSLIGLRFLGEYNGVTNRFFTCLTNQLSTTGVWQRVVVPIHAASNWIGGTATEFTNALSNVRQIEVQFLRRGTAPQSFRIDNFSRVDTVPASVATNDTDADGLPDYWEVVVGNNPTSTYARADLDHDGADNLREFLAGTDPNDYDVFLSVHPGSNRSRIELVFRSVYDRIQHVQRATRVQPGAPDWQTITNNVQSVASTTRVIDTNVVSKAYYRIVYSTH